MTRSEAVQSLVQRSPDGAPVDQCVQAEHEGQQDQGNTDDLQYG